MIPSAGGNGSIKKTYTAYNDITAGNIVNLSRIASTDAVYKHEGAKYFWDRTTFDTDVKLGNFVKTVSAGASSSIIVYQTVGNTLKAVLATFSQDVTGVNVVFTTPITIASVSGSSNHFDIKPIYNSTRYFTVSYCDANEDVYICMLDNLSWTLTAGVPVSVSTTTDFTAAKLCKYYNNASYDFIIMAAGTTTAYIRRITNNTASLTYTVGAETTQVAGNSLGGDIYDAVAYSTHIFFMYKSGATYYTIKLTDDQDDTFSDPITIGGTGAGGAIGDILDIVLTVYAASGYYMLSCFGTAYYFSYRFTYGTNSFGTATSAASAQNSLVFYDDSDAGTPPLSKFISCADGTNMNVYKYSYIPGTQTAIGTASAASSSVAVSSRFFLGVTNFGTNSGNYFYGFNPTYDTFYCGKNDSEATSTVTDYGKYFDSTLEIGIAQETKSAGESIKVRIKKDFDVDDKQSGLGNGQDYYINTSGVLTTTVSNTFIWYAISATELKFETRRKSIQDYVLKEFNPTGLASKSVTGPGVAYVMMTNSVMTHPISTMFFSSTLTSDGSKVPTIDGVAIWSFHSDTLLVWYAN